MLLHTILESFQPLNSARILFAAFLAILFLQSGLDKVVDWKGNLSWLKSHFANSPLSGIVPLLLGIVTITEVAAGVFSLIGVGFLLFTDNTAWAAHGAQLSALSLVMLFFGQRLAKDYEGAASLVPYFILAVLGIIAQSSLLG
ncbi:DoxX family protein [Pontibacter sp. G13]|uniref:DoxX family protein n=1 Tax=Pontibacter sp. G13 TaxID=3074898 RepID=UPI00288AA670|nr:DoxX family protein [Pontibacter sp. G13]WNJ19803.1 DoxX family protein [Pontibacter sp. G13]